MPEKYRRQWSINPLHKNSALVEWLRDRIAAGRIEPMLHGYHHDEEDRLFEFVDADRLTERVRDGKKYLEDLLGSAIRVFVAPRNGIGREGLKAIANEGLHLAGVAGHPNRMASIVSADVGHLVAYPQMEVARRTRDSLGSQPWGSQGNCRKCRDSDIQFARK